MPKRVLPRLVPLLASTVLLACGANQPPAGPLPAGLIGVPWRVVTLGESSGFFNGAGGDLTLQLSANRTATGYTGCNRFRTTFMQNGDTLRFGPIITTRVGCPGNFTSEQHYVAALTGTNRFEVTADSLVLYQGPTAGVVLKR